MNQSRFIDVKRRYALHIRNNSGVRWSNRLLKEHFVTVEELLKGSKGAQHMATLLMQDSVNRGQRFTLVLFFLGNGLSPGLTNNIIRQRYNWDEPRRQLKDLEREITNWSNPNFYQKPHLAKGAYKYFDIHTKIWEKFHKNDM